MPLIFFGGDRVKVKSLIHCTGLGYKDFKRGEIRDLRKEIAEKLLKIGYVEQVKNKKKAVTKNDARES